MNINDLKKLVKHCVYEEKGIVCMNDTYYVDMIHTIENLQYKICKANEVLDKLCVMKPYESVNGEIHKYYRPVKNTTKQEVYKAICDLREILKEDK